MKDPQQRPKPPMPKLRVDVFNHQVHLRREDGPNFTIGFPIARVFGSLHPGDRTPELQDIEVAARVLGAATLLLPACELAYTVLGDYRNQDGLRHTQEYQQMLCLLRDAIAMALGRHERDVQDDYCTRLARLEETMKEES